MKPVEYIFTVDSLSPSTAPMQRVAQYFLELANLLGQSDHVHFHQVSKGSLRCHALAEYEHTASIEQRIQQIADVGSDASKVFDKLNQMLAKDNAVGRLDRVSADGVSAKIYSFPGRELPKPTALKLRQTGSLDGVVVSVGGRDNSSHVHLDAGDGRYWKCETSRELAVDLARYLYGQTVRVHGAGTWTRDVTRKWALEGYFHVESFEVLRDETLGEVLDHLRAVGTDWDKQESISEAWMKLREGDC